jgi:hypothetical protein
MCYVAGMAAATPPTQSGGAAPSVVAGSAAASNSAAAPAPEKVTVRVSLLDSTKVFVTLPSVQSTVQELFDQLLALTGLCGVCDRCNGVLFAHLSSSSLLVQVVVLHWIQRSIT